MTVIKNFLSSNATTIIAGIFLLGGTATTITMQGVRIAKLEESADSYVTYSVLDLKQQTLDGRLVSIEDEVSSLKNRVRRKIDGDLHNVKHVTDDLRLDGADREARLKQTEDELDGVWKFINKFLEELK